MKEADLSNSIPDICESFEYNGRKYRVTGWMKDYISKPLENKENIPEEIFQIFVKLREERNKEKRYQWCERNEAQYVTGSGIAGCIAPIDKVKRTGYYVDWLEECIEDAKRTCELFIGEISL